MIPNISSVNKVRFIKNTSNRVQSSYTQQVENLKTKLDKLSEKDSIVAKNNILRIVNAIQYQLNVKGEVSNSYKNKIICEIKLRLIIYLMINFKSCV